MSSPSLHHASMPSPLPSTHSLASSSPSRSPHLARAQSRIASRHAPPQHRLLLLQPDGLAHRLSSDELVHEIAEARRISHSISSLSLKSKQGRHQIEAHHGPLGRYGSQPSPPRRRRRSASQSASSAASSKRLSSSQSMPFYRLDHHEESSPEFSPLFTPPTLRKAPSTRKRAGYHARAASAASYLFPLPPTGGSGSEAEQDEHDANFEGLGLDLGLNWSTLIDRQEAVESSSAEENQHCCYDSDGLTGSQGWSPDTTAFDTGSNMASPFLEASTPVRPLSIRKTSAAVHDDDDAYLEPFDVEDEADAADETEKLARLSQSLSLLSMDAPAQDDEGYEAVRYADDADFETNSAMSPSVVRAIYSPERAAPSLQEQLAFACGNGYQYRGTTPAVGMARVVSSSAEGYLRHPVGSSSPAESLDPMSGLRAVVGDSWSEAHGCGYDEEDEREGRYDEEEEEDERRWENVDEEDSFWMRRDSLAHEEQQQQEDNDVSVVIYDAAASATSAPQSQAHPQPRRSSPLQSRRPFRASLLLPSPTLLSSSPILSGLLSSTPPADSSFLTDHDALAAAHRQIRVEQLFREPLTSNNITPRSESSAEEFPSRRASIEVVDEEQASAQPSTLPLPQSSPEVAFSLNQEFGSYWSLMETGSPRETQHGSSNSKRSHRPPAIALPASPFSPEASFDLSSFKTPEPLDGLPSPQAVDGERPFAFGGERPSIDVTDSRTAIPTSFSMVNLTAPAHPHASICSAVSMSITQSQATAATAMTSSTSTSSILDRGRPVPASASAGGFLGRNRDESVRMARAQAVKTLEGGASKKEMSSPLKEEIKVKGPLIPRRTTSMGRLRAAALAAESERSEKEEGASNSVASGGSSEAETIRRVWWQKQQQQQQAASDDEDDNLPSVRPVLSTSASMPLPVALIPGHPAGPEAPSSTKRPSVSSASGSSMSMTSSSTASSSISVERTRSPRPRALSRGASEALKRELAEMGRASAPPAAAKQQPPQPQRRVLPGSQSMVSLPTQQATRPSPPRPHLPPPRSTTSLAYIPPAPRKIASMVSHDTANYSLPTLFIARTNSQRMRGETGIDETDPRKIAKVAARAARREVSAGQGILLQSTRRGVPVGKREVEGSPMPRQVRWGNVAVDRTRRGSEESVQAGKEKELPTVPREAPGGVVLVVEETRVSVE